MIDTNKPKILYVDDEQANLDAFVAVYRPYYTIFTETSGARAIEVLKQHEIELIITDQRMPEMTGVQFLEAILPQCSSPVRMILTGFSDIDAIIQAVNNGLVMRYITKPWSEDELKQIIDGGIKIYRQEKSNMLLKTELHQLIKKYEKMIDIFQKYVPKDIVDHIVNPLSADEHLKVENRFVSVLFCDIHHFITLSERLDSKVLVSYLNSYMSLIINIVIKHNGYVYKILGDGLIAVFGAPRSSLNNQLNAANCASEIIKELDNFNKSMHSKINFDTAVGMAITSGEAIVGHTVSKQYLSYSIIGKVIENALTIEALTRNLPNTLLLDEVTYQFLKNNLKVEPFQTTTLDGKEQQVYKFTELVIS